MRSILAYFAKSTRPASALFRRTGQEAGQHGRGTLRAVLQIEQVVRGRHRTQTVVWEAVVPSEGADQEVKPGGGALKQSTLPSKQDQFEPRAQHPGRRRPIQVAEGEELTDGVEARHTDTFGQLVPGVVVDLITDRFELTAHDRHEVLAIFHRVEGQAPSKRHEVAAVLLRQIGDRRGGVDHRVHGLAHLRHLNIVDISTVTDDATHDLDTLVPLLLITLPPGSVGDLAREELQGEESDLVIRPSL